MPVSEVGDAVVGRGFALLHKVSGGPESVDTAEHLWTLDNPAYSWFGLSSAARVRVDDSVRAVSVAEVVSPDEAMSGPLARDLMVALVRAGVTATCSGADKPRYGHLDVDSNLPDTRIALGGPARNAFTKAVLAQADPIYTEELDRQLAETGRARVWVPAATPVGGGVAARRRPACCAGAAGAGDRRVGREKPGRRDRGGDRRPRRRPDRRQPAGPGGHGTFRCSHRRAAQPWRPELRRRDRRHPAYRADAVLHRLAVRRLDRRAAPHRARRLELPTSALDTRFRLRAGERRRRLAARADPRPQCAVLPPAARRRLRRTAGTAGAGGLAAARRSRRLGAPGRPQGGRQPAGGRQRRAGRPRHRGLAAGGNDRDRHPRRHRLRAGQGARAAARRPAGNAAGKPGTPQTVGGPARLPGGHRASPARATHAGRDHCPAGPSVRKPPSPCTRGIGCTTAAPRPSADCPPSRTCTRSRRPPSRATRWCCGSPRPATAATPP